MITFTEDKVIFSKDTWEELKSDSYFNEVIEAIEDREELKKSIQETEYIVDFKEYDKQRRARINV